ncbi:hypothetical protein AB4099_31165 [Bosea sp. 2KB_26]|uniref:hypothetical protein n=1 Tax=Bosea sp. 2KB_26 TaxID=3237475 RepID=UPI003F8E041F
MLYDNYQTRLEAERLRLSNPETVYAWLSTLPAAEGVFTGNCADGIVKTLPERDDPLINLALARFTANDRLLKPLWDKGGLMRTALLANRAYGPVFPTSGIFSLRDLDPLQPVIEEMTVDDLDALYSNPRCPAVILDYTFRNTIGLSEDRHLLACRFAIRNERLRKTLNPIEFNEFWVTDHAAPIHTIWETVRTAPATESWASILAEAGSVAFCLGLPEEFEPDMSTFVPDMSKEEFQEALATRFKHCDAYRAIFMQAAQTRWLGPEEQRNDPRGPWIWARAAISEAICRDRPHVPAFTGEHPDLGFRIGFYRAAAVSPDWDIEAMAEKDGTSFTRELVWNESLYERVNHELQKRFRRLIDDDGVSWHTYAKWMAGKLEELVAKDPRRYGDEPTEEMRLYDERQAAAAEARRRQEEAAAAPPQPAQKGWRIFSR